jgi:hypothetical protein
MNSAILEKIKDILDDYGYQSHDFDITIENHIEEYDSDEKEEDNIQYIILIKQKSSGKKKRYSGDNYSLWLSDFEQDLQEQFFEFE